MARHSCWGRRCYNLASTALGLALLSLLDQAAVEQAIFAIACGLAVLRTTLAPALAQRRSLLAIGVAAAQVVLVVTVSLVSLDRLPPLIDAWRTLSDLR